MARAPAKSKPAVRPAYIKPSAAKLRRSPNPDAEVIGFARRAEHVMRLAAKGSWVKIRVEDDGALSYGKEGWVPADLLSDTKPK